MSWPIVRITEVARVVGGATPKTEINKYWGGEIPWATPKDLSNLGQKLIAQTDRQITTDGLKSCAAEVLPKGSVLFSSRAPIGHVAINDIPMATNQGFKSFIPNERLDASFLYWWLDANRTRLQAMGTGATFKEVSKATVEKIEIPLPPLEEQKRIAGILDQADALRRLRARALEKLNTLGQAVFQEMFGDPLINPKNFQTSHLAAICNFSSGATPSKSDASLWNGNFPWVSPKDMKRPEIWGAIDHISAAAFEKSSLKKIPINSVLIVVRGMILAHSVPLALTKVPCAINQDMKAMVFTKDFDPLFVFHCLQAMKGTILSLVDNAAHGTKRLDMKDLSSLPILSPSLTEQQEFTRRASAIEAQIKNAQLAADKSLALFSSLQSAAFQGKL